MSSDEKLVQMTIRVPQEIKNLIVEEATKQSCSSSEVVRNSVLSNLSGYYDDVEYIDPNQAEIMIATIKDVCTEIHNVKNALSAIGRNYNQQVRALNVVKKFSEKRIDVHDMLEEFRFIENDCNNFTQEKLDKIMERYDNISKFLWEEIMCYTRISGTRNGKKAIAYALGNNGRGHNGHRYRNLMIGTVGLLPEDVLGSSYLEQMEAIWAQKLSNNNLNQIRRIIVSFSPNELSKDNPEDIELAMQMCQEFCEESYDGHDALICLSADGKGSSNSPGSKLHAHILINNISSRDFRGCSREQTHFSYVMKEWNKVQSRYIAIDLGKGPKDKISQNERHMREENEKAIAMGLPAPHFIWKDVLKAKIKTAMDTATSKENFFENLLKCGVTAKLRKEGKPGEYISYQLIDLPPHYEEIRGYAKARSYTLGTDYDIEMLMKKIEENRLKNPVAERHNEVDISTLEYINTPISSAKKATDDTNSDAQENNSSSASSAPLTVTATSNTSVEVNTENIVEKDIRTETKKHKPMTAYERLKYEKEKMDRAEKERQLDRQLEYGYGKEF